MAIPHVQPGEVIDVHPLANTLASSQTRTLIKTPHVEVIRMVLSAGKVLAEHKAPGEITVQCLEGRMTFRTMGQTKQLQPGDLLYLSAEEAHSVEAIEDSSFLLTMVLPRPAE
jgi:quercetin dioxygenase-like cupin family protein